MQYASLFIIKENCGLYESESEEKRKKSQIYFISLRFTFCHVQLHALYPLKLSFMPNNRKRKK